MITNAKALANADRLLDGNPVTCDLFLTRKCCNACGYCTYTRYMRRSGADMSPELFDRVLARLQELDVRGVILTGGGDPLCSDTFEHACKAMEAAGMPYGINTNFVQYRECKPVYLKVSLDAWDAESYKAIRGTDDWERVTENIRRYASYKAAESPQTAFLVQAVCKSVDDMTAFYNANKSLPVDAMVVRPVESTRGSYYTDPRAWGQAWAIKTYPLYDDRLIVNPKFYQLERFDGKCSANHMQIAVDECANVIYCCHKPYEIVGSLFDDDILEKRRLYRTDFSKCDVPCRLTSANELVEKARAQRALADYMFI